MLGLKLAFAGIAAIAAVTIITLGYNHYTGLIESVNVLTKNNTELTNAVDEQDRTIAAQDEAIDEWKISQDNLIKRMDDIQIVAHDAAQETRRLNDIFSRHDLTDLARKRPGLIENRINAGTADAIRMLACASGARRTDCPN